jgi:hypothetical protein
LLRRVGLELAHEGRRVRRIDDHQVLQALRMLDREIPGHRAAPIVGDQRLERAAELVDQGGDVGDQVLGAVGLDLGRRRRAGVPAQVGGDASVALAEVAQQLVPDKRRLGKAVQEHEQRRTHPARGAAFELNSVRKLGSESLDGVDDGLRLEDEVSAGEILRAVVCATCVAPPLSMMERRRQTDTIWRRGSKCGRPRELTVTSAWCQITVRTNIGA